MIRTHAGFDKLNRRGSKGFNGPFDISTGVVEGFRQTLRLRSGKTPSRDLGQPASKCELGQ